MNPPRTKSVFSPCHWFTMTAILLLGWLLYSAALGADARFHPDEALYMTAARSAAVRGDWLLVTIPQDKPPITMYLNALSLVFFGTDTDVAGVLHLDVHQGEFAGRLVSVWSALLLIAVVMAVARELFGHKRAMMLAGLLTALSPYVVAYSATAFTDMPMVLFGMFGLLCALKRRAGLAGWMTFLAFASKPQGLVYLPLMLLIVWRGDRTRLIFALIPWAIGGSLLWAWDTARIAKGAIDVWTLGRANYATPAFAPIAEWGERLQQWSDYGRALFGDALTLPTVIFAILAVLYSRTSSSGSTHRLMIRSLLLLWCAAYVLVHVLTTVPLYDRYLLPLVPMIALLTAYGVIRLGNRLHGRIAYKLAIVGATAVMFFYAGMAAQQRLYIGGDLGAHTGIDHLAAYLNEKPVATVIYDPWLGWELRYYLGPWTNKRRVHYPTPQSLVADALQLPETGTRYLVAPEELDLSEWISALESAGFTTEQDTQIGKFVVVAITPPSHPA